MPFAASFRATLLSLFCLPLVVSACGAPEDSPRLEGMSPVPAGSVGPWEHYLDVAGDDLLSWHANTSEQPVGPLMQIDGDEIRFTLPGFFLGTKSVDGRTYTRALVPGLPPLSEAGYPELPVMRQSFIVPPGFDGEVVVTESSYVDVPIENPILPSRGPLERDVTPEDIPYVEGPFYGSSDAFPASELVASAPFTLRATTGLPIRVQPFQAVGGSETLRVFTQIRARIISDEPLVIERSSEPESPDFAALYGRIFGGAARYQSIAETGRMVIISADEYVDAVEPLADWKNQRGLPTEIVPLSELGDSASAVQSYIASQYHSAAGLTYVILVGDVEMVPTLRGTYESADSDTKYAMVAGDDLYPDLFVSRISAQSPNDVSTQVAKIIEYERDPDPFGTWYTTAIGIGSDEGSPSDWQRMEDLREALEGYGYTDIGTVYDPGASASEVTARINDGINLINYCGHGAGDYWVTTGFGVQDASALTNTGKYPVVIDVSCVNGAFADYDACLAESMLRAGTPAAPAGAIGMFSASTNASWVPPTVMQAHAVESLFIGESIYTLGGLYYGGAMQTLDEYGSGEGTKLVEQYNIFGDASLQIRTQRPRALTVNHPRVITAAGQLVLDITYSDGDPAVNATAALSQHSRLVGVTTTSSGEAVVSYGGLGSGTAQLTVTAFNAVPYIIQLPIEGSGNQPPIANAGQNQSVMPNATVALDGSASYDPEGEELVSVQWMQTAGPSVTLSSPDSLTTSFVAPLVEEFTNLTFSLVVNDGEYDSTVDSVTVLVKGHVIWSIEQEATDTPLSIPDNDSNGIHSNMEVAQDGAITRAEVEVDITHTYIGDLTVTLDCPGTGSQVLHERAGGADNDIHEIYEVTACNGDASGTWTLRVTDHAGQDEGTLDAWTLRLKTAGGAVPENHVPLANAGEDLYVDSEANVVLDGTSSSDPDGDPLSYSWTQTAGPTVALVGADTAQPSFVAPSVSASTTLEFSLVVSDASSSSDPAAAFVFVEAVAETARVLINEVMVNPDCVEDSVGEWIELYNPSDYAVAIDGWTLTDQDIDRFVLPSLTIPARGFLVLCRSANALENGNVACDASYSRTLLANAGDEVELYDAAGTLVDQLIYGPAAAIGAPIGASLERREGTPATFEPATSPIEGGCGDLGSPGAANY